MSDLEFHVDQLIVSLNSLKKADELRNPTNIWEYCPDELSSLKDEFNFRKLQVTERAKYLIKMLEEE